MGETNTPIFGTTGTDLFKMVEIVKLVSDCGTTNAEISTQGATVTSWTINGEERIFLSKKAIMEKPLKAIRGGIPLVFPNFGPWKKGTQHGFARQQLWKIAKKTDRSATFELSETDYSMAMWPHKFTLNYSVKVSTGKLIASLEVKNTNEMEAFDFTALFHTYFRVPDISKTETSGFQNAEYLNALTNTNHTETSVIKIGENVERVYKNTADEHFIEFGKTKIEIKKSGLPDTVVWNPWVEKAKAMDDFDDEEYKEMIGVEAGKVVEKQVLKSGEVWQCEQVFMESERQTRGENLVL